MISYCVIAKLKKEFLMQVYREQLFIFQLCHKLNIVNSLLSPKYIKLKNSSFHEFILYDFECILVNNRKRYGLNNKICEIRVKFLKN